MDSALPTTTRLSPAPRPRCTASRNAVRLRDLPRAEQGRFAMAIQRSRTTAASQTGDGERTA